MQYDSIQLTNGKTNGKWQNLKEWKWTCVFQDLEMKAGGA